MLKPFQDGNVVMVDDQQNQQQQLNKTLKGQFQCYQHY